MTLTVGIDARRALWMGHTGIGRYVGELVAHAGADPAFTYEALIAAGQRPAGTAPVRWRSVRPGLGQLSRLAWEQVAVPASLRRRPVDVLHLPWYEGSPHPGVPFVLTIQDLHSIDVPSAYPRSFAYYNALLPRLARRAALVIAPSDATARSLGRVGVGEDRVRVIRYGHDPALAGLRAQGPPLGSTGNVLYCGGYGERKRLDVLLGAMTALPAARLQLVGNVPADVLELVAELGLRDRVELPGRISDAELRDAFRSADALAYPSEYEGFGFPALEALTAGVPLVASGVSSVPEIAGEAGWLVAPGDRDAFTQALETALSAGPEVRARVELGLTRALGFDWDACVRHHGAVYREVASS